MRIAFTTDIHLDAAPTGWQQQPRWCEGTGRLLELLGERLRELKVDLTILGGDMVEQGTPEAIERAVAALRQLPGTVLVCLGNHDLTQVSSYPCWRRAMWNWPAAALADAILEYPECDVCGLNSHWQTGNEAKLFWNQQAPVAAITREQAAKLDAWLGRRAERPAIVALHAPLEALPPELTGAAAPMEAPPADYAAPLREVLARHPRARLVLSGHCHATCATPLGSGMHLSSTSLTEVPFQFPVIDVKGGELAIGVQRLTPQEAAPEVNAAKAWALGRETDRQFSVRCGA